ncbi:glycosyltransferase family 4 protein [Ahniella affigens]|uniref:glycosyltransferase family 4 protein n=1 Tax=Ahniella affigens TaxID=2021234 RepID=UPI0011B20BE0|nr:glycosyltransferase family 4 protein [Ahniella affigens]
MKISICTGPILPVPAIKGGAVHRFWAQMAPAFASAGHDVHVYARADASQRDSEFSDHVHWHRAGGYAQATSALWNMARSWRDARHLAPRLAPADVLISNDIALPRVIAKRPETGRLIIALGRQPKGQLRWYPRVDGIAAASQSVAEQVALQAPALATCTTVLPYAIDTSVFHTDAATPRDADALLFAGRLHPEKGLLLLIDAFRILHARRPSRRLRIIGPWQTAQGGAGPAFREALRTRALGLPVQWSEPEFDAARLAAIYREHAVFLYPSLAEQGETFGLAPLEAMACGAVPVTSALPCFRDYLKPGHNGDMFDHRAENPALALADATERALAAAGSAGAALHATSAAFSVPAVATRWLEALSNWSRV